MGDEAGRLLLIWRLYTSGIGIVLGGVLALRYFGWEPVRQAARRLMNRPA
jgi:hypothetical protein